MKTNLKRSIGIWALLLLAVSTVATAGAQAADVENEIAQLKERLASLEQRQTQSARAEGADLEERMARLEREVDRLGYRKFPVKLMESLGGVGFGAGLTMIGQGTGNNAANQDKTDLSLSSDLRLSFPVGPHGMMLLRHHTGQGAGIAGLLPPVFSGPNADLEFNAQQPNLVEAWYGMTLPWPNIRDPRITLNIGKLDPTGFFDANRFANNEAEQFMANAFVNNTAIEFGGDANGYGFGGRAAWRFTSVYQKGLTVVGSYGYFDNAGDFSQTLRQPFHIAELDVTTKNYGFERNVRVYGWMNRKDHTRWLDQNGDRKSNRGVGVSWDEDVSNNVGMFLRYGFQDPDVAKFDHALTLGMRVIGNSWRRSRDHVGFAYGLSRISDDFKRVSAQTDGYPADTNEHSFEAYYKWYVLGSFYLTPDVQYIISPGGDDDKDGVWILGIRQQLNF